MFLTLIRMPESTCSPKWAARDKAQEAPGSSSPPNLASKPLSFPPLLENSFSVLSLDFLAVQTNARASCKPYLALVMSGSISLWGPGWPHGFWEMVHPSYFLKEHSGKARGVAVQQWCSVAASIPRCHWKDERCWFLYENVFLQQTY